jgi:hypothetical protein
MGHFGRGSFCRIMDGRIIISNAFVWSLRSFCRTSFCYPAVENNLVVHYLVKLLGCGFRLLFNTARQVAALGHLQKK